MVQNHLSSKLEKVSVAEQRPRILTSLIVLGMAVFLGGCFDGSLDKPNANQPGDTSGSVADNTPPTAVADPGPTQSKYVEVILDGRGSTDPNPGDLDRDPVTGVPTYQWEFVAVPAPFPGDPATEWAVAPPGSPGAPLPYCEPRGGRYPEPADDFDCDHPDDVPVAGLARFTPDNGGILPTTAQYVIRLTVTDWVGASSTDEVTYAATFSANQPPTADAGMDILEEDWDPDAGQLDIGLDGSASTDDGFGGSVLTYEWRVDDFESSVSPITRDDPAIDDPTISMPTITLDDIYQIGVYTYELRVSDGTFTTGNPF